MKFSVLMSVYKKEKADYLQVCLESLMDQTLQADEYVIIEDGPLTDELQQVLADFQKKNPESCRLYPFKKNRGLGQALADGVRLANHDWIARMDTDDIARKDRFEKQVQCLKDHPDLGLIGSEILEFEKQPEDAQVKRTVPEHHDDILEYAKRRNPFNHMTVFYNRQEVLEAGNYQDLTSYEDYYLWCRMLAHGVKTYNIQEPLVYARADEEMYKRRGGWDYFKHSVRAYNTIYKLGLAGPKDWLIRNGAQAAFNLAPNQLRSKLYQRFLRK